MDVFFADDTGAAVTGKVAADFPVCKWSGGSNTADTTITLSDLAAITTAHPNDNTAGGVKEREGGWYRLDLPNNMLTSAGRKTLTFAETTNKRLLAPFVDCQYVQGDVRQLLGTAWLTPGTAGTPDVNAKLWNGLTTVALPLVPTTAGRTLDVSATGEAGLDWANVGSPTTSLALTGTTIAATQKVDIETIKTNPVVNAGTVTFPTTATLASTTNITAGTIATVTGNVGGIAGTTQTLDALQTALASAHGAGSWATATGFAVAGDAMTLTSGERNAVAAALLALADGIETGLTLKQALRLVVAGIAGKRSNSGTATETYDAAGNPGTPRIVGNLNASGDGTPTLTP
ncbi:MAG: hypothetical protein V4597_11550 [Pseudomonadota bacterium]